ncbi:MAG: GNAT family N-acetyltransferase [Pirellulales bacterium]
MRAEVVTTVAGIADLRDEWNRLAAGDPLASWEWRDAWWQAYGGKRRLAVGVVRRHDRILALLPAFREHRPWSGRTLAMLGNGKACTDYQRILLDPDLDEPHRRATVDFLVDELVRPAGLLPPIDLFEIDGADTTDMATEALIDSLEHRGFTVERESLESSWICDFADTWDEFVGGTPRQLRRKIHKAIRREDDPEVSYHEAEDVETVGAIWPEFVRLHQARFRDRTDDGGCFVYPHFEDFLRDAVLRLVEKSQAKIVWCEHAGRPISAHLYLLGRRTAAMYQSGFDPEYQHLEPGYLLYTLAFRSLINAGYAHFDFLRGDETYKAGWTARSIPLTRLVCIAPTAVAQVRHRTRSWARSLKRSVARAVREYRARKHATPAAAKPTIGSDGVEIAHEKQNPETVNA